MTDGAFKSSAPSGLPYDLEQLVTLRRWMLVLFGVAILLGLVTYWLWQNHGLEAETTQILVAASLFAVVLTWAAMVRVTFLLHGWILAIMLAVASLFFQILIPVGVIFLNYQVSDKLAEHKKQ